MEKEADMEKQANMEKEAGMEEGGMDEIVMKQGKDKVIGGAGSKGISPGTGKRRWCTLPHCGQTLPQCTVGQV